MGRVHHRILYFVHFCPGITIKEILSVLDVRHQNIQPSLRHLISQGYLAPRADAGDARIKRLYTSRKGDKLLEFIGLNQRARFARGFQSVASRDVLSYFKVMISMLDPDRRAWADRLTRLDDPSRIV